MFLPLNQSLKEQKLLDSIDHELTGRLSRLYLKAMLISVHVVVKRDSQLRHLIISLYHVTRETQLHNNCSLINNNC